MKVKELIKELKKLPPKANVFNLQSGEPRKEINVVYQSKSNRIILADFDEPVYSTYYRPKDAPTKEVDRRWTTPKK
jgi:hypothetical protein